MKIAIASDDEKTISSHFGKTKGFCIFEVEGKEIKSQQYLPNTFTDHARGLEGAGHKAHDHDHTPILVALKDCKAVIAHGMGRRIRDDLTNIGIEVFVTEETDVKKALNLYLGGELIDKPETGCHHKHR
jgi:Uncharacterized conserved protein